VTYYKAVLTIDFEAATDQEAESIGLVAAKFLERLGESQGVQLIEIEEITPERQWDES